MRCSELLDRLGAVAVALHVQLQSMVRLVDRTEGILVRRDAKEPECHHSGHPFRDVNHEVEGGTVGNQGSGVFRECPFLS